MKKLICKSPYTYNSYRQWVQKVDQSMYVDQREYSNSKNRKVDRHSIELPHKAAGYEDASLVGGSVRHAQASA